LAGVLAAGVVLVLGGGIASADLGSDPKPPTTTTGAGGNGTSYTARVTYTPRGIGTGGQPITSTDGNFTPPVCWYSSFTPAQFKAEIDRRYLVAGHSGAGTVYDYYNQVQSRMNQIRYHQGDEGSWWVLTWDASLFNTPNAWCPYTTDWYWSPPGNPPKGAITPKILAEAAYRQLRLVSQGVALSPKAGNQKVNLPTYVSYTAPAAQESVTARLTEPDGTVVAATVVAQPDGLHVDAGTSYADPQSCDYRLSGAGSGAAASFDSAHADCNITYRRASAGTYPLGARMTWRVWWTATATPQPNGAALPDGLSRYQQDVTVQEIQTVNR